MIQSIQIEENRFGFELEVTAKLARKKFVFYEVGISYYGRTYSEGKKIGVQGRFQGDMRDPQIRTFPQVV